MEDIITDGEHINADYGTQFGGRLQPVVSDTLLEGKQDELIRDWTLTDAFTVNNSLSSAISNSHSESFEPDETYDQTDASLYEGYEDYTDKLVYAESMSELESMKQGIDRELNSREALYNGGWTATVASMGAAVLDPVFWGTMAIPGVGYVKGAKVTSTALNFGAKSAIGAAVSEAVTEAALHGSQDVRTIEESAINTIAASFLGGTIGTALQARKAGTYKSFEKSINNEFSDIVASDKSAGSMQTDMTIDELSLMMPTLFEQGMKELPAWSRIVGDVGANAAGRASPLVRGLTSPSVETRGAMLALSENPFILKAHLDGKKLPASVETLIKARHSVLEAESVDVINTFHAQYKKRVKQSDEGGSFNFDEEIGSALITGKSNTPEAMEAAKWLRDNVFVHYAKVLKQTVDDNGTPLLTPDADPMTYLTRMWNPSKIMKNENGLREALKKHLMQEQTQSIEKSAVKREKLKKSEGKLTKDYDAPIGESQELLTSLKNDLDIIKTGMGAESKLSVTGKASNIGKAIEKARAKMNTLKSSLDVPEDSPLFKKSLHDSHKALAKTKEKVAELEMFIKEMDESLNFLRKIEAEGKVSKSSAKVARETEKLIRNIERVSKRVARLTKTRSRQASAKLKVREKIDEIDAKEPLDDLMMDSEVDDIISSLLMNPQNLVGHTIEVGTSGSLKQRTLTIPTKDVMDFVDLNASNITRHYIRSVGPSIELTERFGSKSMYDILGKDGKGGKMREDITRMAKAAKTPEESAKIWKRGKADIKLIEAMRDRVIGSYGAPSDPSDVFVRTGSFMKGLNVIRLMGQVPISSIPDLANQVKAAGWKKNGALVKMMVTDFKKIKIAREEMKKIGAVLELSLSSRMNSFSDMFQDSAQRTVGENVMKSAVTKSGYVFGINYWNQGMKEMAAYLTQDRIYGMAKNYASLSKMDKARLASVRIDEDMAGRLVTNYEKHLEYKGDINLSRVHEWEDKELMEVFRGMIMEESDRIIITPGISSRPLFMSSQLGSFVTQFMSFAFAATTKGTMAGLQGKDMRFYSGSMMAIGLGALTYAIKAEMAGRDVNTDGANLMAEGIDRSGILGILPEIRNIGLAAGLPLGGELSRYRAKQKTSTLTGPSGGLISDAFSVTHGALTGELTDTDIHRGRMLMPAQNFPLLMYPFNVVEGIAKDSIR